MEISATKHPALWSSVVETSTVYKEDTQGNSALVETEGILNSERLLMCPMMQGTLER